VLGAGTDAAPPDADLGWDDADTFREQAERLMMEAISTGAVILGRGGTAALRNEPGVLRVRLFGDVARRIAQGAIVEGVDESTARARQPKVDAARRLYFRKLYHDDIDQLTYYHLLPPATRQHRAAPGHLRRHHRHRLPRPGTARRGHPITPITAGAARLALASDHDPS
jgi:hypothetical protein